MMAVVVVVVAAAVFFFLCVCVCVCVCMGARPSSLLYYWMYKACCLV